MKNTQTHATRHADAGTAGSHLGSGSAGRGFLSESGTHGTEPVLTVNRNVSWDVIDAARDDIVHAGGAKRVAAECGIAYCTLRTYVAPMSRKVGSLLRLVILHPATFQRAHAVIRRQAEANDSGLFGHVMREVSEVTAAIASDYAADGILNETATMRECDEARTCLAWVVDAISRRMA